MSRVHHSSHSCDVVASPRSFRAVASRPVARAARRVHSHSRDTENANVSYSDSTSQGLSLSNELNLSTLAGRCAQGLQLVRQAGLDAWKSYEGELSAHPVRTKALTSMVGLALGDMIAQSSTGCFDPARTARMAAFGVALHGPAGHLWYRLLDANVMPKNGSSPQAIVAKMVLDQAVFAPLFTAIFYASLTLMEGRPSDVAEVVSARLIPTVLSGYALWPLAHLVSFKFIPSEFRLLYINAVNLVWTVHLSKLASAPIACDPATVAPVYGSAVTSPPAAFQGGMAPIPVSHPISPPATDFVFVPEHITPHEI